MWRTMLNDVVNQFAWSRADLRRNIKGAAIGLAGMVAISIFGFVVFSPFILVFFLLPDWAGLAALLNIAAVLILIWASSARDRADMENKA